MLKQDKYHSLDFLKAEMVQTKLSTCANIFTINYWVTNYFTTIFKEQLYVFSKK